MDIYAFRDAHRNTFRLCLLSQGHSRTLRSQQRQFDPTGNQHTGKNTAAAAPSHKQVAQETAFCVPRWAGQGAFIETVSSPHLHSPYALVLRGRTAENCFVRSHMGTSHEKQTTKFLQTWHVTAYTFLHANKAQRQPVCGFCPATGLLIWI